MKINERLTIFAIALQAQCKELPPQNSIHARAAVHTFLNLWKNYDFNDSDDHAVIARAIYTALSQLAADNVVLPCQLPMTTFIKAAIVMLIDTTEPDTPGRTFVCQLIAQEGHTELLIELSKEIATERV